MIVYIDLVFVINFLFDFCLLLSVDLILKRHTKKTRIIIGSLLGEISMITLFVNFSKAGLLMFKIMLSFIMAIVTYGKKDKKYIFYNVVYLYLSGIILGGFITYLYNQFKINREYSLRYLIILFLSPIILFVYSKLMNKLKNNYNNCYKVIIDYENNHYEGIGFLDSGNKLVSPISGKPIILIEKEYIILHKLKLLPVPYTALNHHGILNCFKPDRLLINNKNVENVLVGISEVKFNIEGCSVLLNARMEDL